MPSLESNDIHAQQRASLRKTVSGIHFEGQRRSPLLQPQQTALTLRQLAQRTRRLREAAEKAGLTGGTQGGRELGGGGRAGGRPGNAEASGSQQRQGPLGQHHTNSAGSGIAGYSAEEPRSQGPPLGYRAQGQRNRAHQAQEAQVLQAVQRELGAGVAVNDGIDSSSDSDSEDDGDPYDAFTVDGGAMWEKQLDSRIQKVRRSPLYLAARQPYAEPLTRHDLGRMDIPCPHCAALHWKDERLSDSPARSPEFGTCCQRGQVQLPDMPSPPQPLREYLSSVDSTSKKFRENIWQYNRAFSFTSMGVREDFSVNGRGRGEPVFRISGELHHYSGALEPMDGQLPRYAQLYVIEPKDALTARQAQNTGLNPQVMKNLQQMLLDSHAYSSVYLQAWDILQGYDADEDVSVTLRLEAGMDARRYNLPTVGEVAVIIPGPGDTLPRDIVLRRSDQRGLDRISELHPAYVPLQYPLLAPAGTHQWHPDIYLIETEEQKERRLANAAKRRRERRERDGVEDAEEEGMGEGAGQDRKVTLSLYTAYRIHQRAPPDFNIFLRGGRLFQRYIVDMYAAVDQGRLRYIVLNQSKFRAARFNNLEDAAAHEPDNVDLNEIGERVFLPSSYIGGPRNMTQCFQDSMSLARFFKKVDIFLTMTTNPEWDEIQRELLPGQTAYDRPDLVARVFRMKQKAVLDYIHMHGIFGVSVAYVYTIEFQKRGLPHMHLLIFLKDRFKLLTPEAVDSCISAQWPDQETQPKLFATVKKCMVHGPCGVLNPNAICMVNGKCSKGYPKAFQEDTAMGESGYALYQRRNDGRSYEVQKVFLDNRWIVPYSPFLSAEFDCHINVECAVSLASMAYTFKYIQKGPDRGMIELHNKDEVKAWLDGRYISAPDAAYRIFHFPIHHQTPNVVRLAIHLPGEHVVLFNRNDNLEALLEQGANKKTTLTAFFRANADAGALGEVARQLTYQEFPQKLTFQASTGQWAVRKQGFALGRMFFIRPTAGEVFYLRTLLTVVKGATSFDDLRRVPGLNQPCETFYAACLAHGLLQDDGEWRLCMREASEMQTGRQIRNLFLTILLFGEPARPQDLWQEFKTAMCTDLRFRILQSGLLLERDVTEEKVLDYGLFVIDELLQEAGRELKEWVGMPKVKHDWSHIAIRNPLLEEHRAYDPEEQLTIADRLHDQLNDGQLAVFNTIIDTISNQHGRVFFLKGSAGTGKTFVYKAICARVRSEGKVIIVVSSSGLSALLIPGGRTAHSIFRIPIRGLNEFSLCKVTKDSHRADLFREAAAIIWDEVGAQHRHAVEAVDRTLRDIRNCELPFGGIPTVLGGDFMQTLPVVPNGSRAEMTDASVQRSRVWEHAEILHLTENMRLQRSNDAGVHRFARWLADVGNGVGLTGDSGDIPLDLTMCTKDEDDLMVFIYPGVDSIPPPPPDYFLNRMILAPRNVDVTAFNTKIIDVFHGDERVYFSADTIVIEKGADPDTRDDIPPEFLRSINAPGIPPGELTLKLGAPVILLRNLNPGLGLCNGTRMTVLQMGDRVLEVRLMGGDHDGDVALIPRIAVIPTENIKDLTFQFKRRQFPLQLAFALTINKAQGQSVRYVGLDLRNPVFAHGQLYVALSRVTASHNIHVLLPSDEPDDQSATMNVVYKDLLI